MDFVRCQSESYAPLFHGKEAETLSKLNEELLSHPLYGQVNSLEKLRIFMESHIFAVWDFMSLAKRLQISLTCTSLPWMPPSNAKSARFINDIILNEETDIADDGRAISHLEMYLEAMQETGASTKVFDKFISSIKSGRSIDEALDNSAIPSHVSRFVRRNIEMSIHGNIEEVASYFLHGREDPIPNMFRRLVSTLEISKKKIPKLIWYLERHIEIDGSDHGPAAKKMLEQITANDPHKIEMALKAACSAIRQRIELWDGIQREIALKT